MIMKKQTLIEEKSRIKKIMGLNEESWEETRARTKRWEDQDLSDYRKRLEKTHFSGGSMHEDFGVLVSKLNNIYELCDRFGGEVYNLIKAIKINMRDSDISGNAQDKLYFIQDSLESMYKTIYAMEKPIGQLTNEMEELSDPAHEIYNSEEEEDMTNPTV